MSLAHLDWIWSLQRRASRVSLGATSLALRGALSLKADKVSHYADKWGSFVPMKVHCIGLPADAVDHATKRLR